MNEEQCLEIKNIIRKIKKIKIDFIACLVII